MPEGSVGDVNSVKQHGGSISNRAAVMVTEQERKLLEALRNLKYGEIRVIIKDYAIVRMEEKKSIKM